MIRCTLERKRSRVIQILIIIIIVACMLAQTVHAEEEERGRRIKEKAE